MASYHAAMGQPSDPIGSQWYRMGPPLDPIEPQWDRILILRGGFGMLSDGGEAVRGWHGTRRGCYGAAPWPHGSAMGFYVVALCPDAIAVDSPYDFAAWLCNPMGSPWATIEQPLGLMEEMCSAGL